MTRSRDPHRVLLSAFRVARCIRGPGARFAGLVLAIVILALAVATWLGNL